MIADTRLLLGLRWQMGWNGFRKRSLGRKLLFLFGMFWLVFGVGGFAVAVGFGAGELIRQFPTVHLEALLPGAILTLIALLLLFTSFGTELGSLFLTNDLDLLMSAPVDRRAVFLSKMLDSVWVNYLVLAVTAVPALVTYGLVLSYGPAYYLLMLLTVLATPLLPTGLGALAVILVARFAPARRVREVLALVGALFGISCSLIGQTTRLWTPGLVRDGGGADARQQVEAFLAQVQGLANLPIPTLLAGRGLTAAGMGDWAGAVSGLAVFALLTGLIFAGCLVLADSMYMQGWVRMQSSGSAKRSQARAARDAANSGWLGRAPADLAIALKDWRVIPRDLRNFAQFIGPLILLPIVYLNLLGGAGRDSFNAYQAASQWAQGRFDPAGIFVAGAVLMFTILIFSHIAATSISMEGKAWWILKAAPIAPFDLLRGKYLVAFLPFAILSTVLLIGAALWRGFSLFGLLYGWFGVELIGAGMLAIAIGFAIPWAKLDWDDPRRMSSGWGWVFTTIGEIILGLLVGGLLIMPVLIETLSPDWTLLGYAAGIFCAAAVTVGIGWAMFQFSLSRLDSVGEV